MMATFALPASSTGSSEELLELLAAYPPSSCSLGNELYGNSPRGWAQLGRAMAYERTGGSLACSTVWTYSVCSVRARAAGERERKGDAQKKKIFSGELGKSPRTASEQASTSTLADD